MSTPAMASSGAPPVPPGGQRYTCTCLATRAPGLMSMCSQAWLMSAWTPHAWTSSPSRRVRRPDPGVGALGLPATPQLTSLTELGIAGRYPGIETNVVDDRDEIAVAISLAAVIVDVARGVTGSEGPEGSGG